MLLAVLRGDFGDGSAISLVCPATTGPSNVRGYFSNVREIRALTMTGVVCVYICVLVFPRHPTISMEAARHWLLLGTEGVACVARHHKQREKRMRAGVEFKFRYFSFPLNLLFLFCLRQRRPLRLSPVTSRSFFRKREII